MSSTEVASSLTEADRLLLQPSGVQKAYQIMNDSEFHDDSENVSNPRQAGTKDLGLRRWCRDVVQRAASTLSQSIALSDEHSRNVDSVAAIESRLRLLENAVSNFAYYIVEGVSRTSIDEKNASCSQVDKTGVSVAVQSTDGFEQLSQLLSRNNQSIQNSQMEMMERLQRLDHRLNELIQDEVDHSKHPLEFSLISILGLDSHSASILPNCFDILMNDVQEESSEARMLFGQLLLVTNSPMDRIAKILTDVGESWYTYAKTRSLSQESTEDFQNWIETTVSRRGVKNRIIIVSPGEPFDSSHHRSMVGARGIEISEVHGWIVLRENGDVLTKALVSVR